MKGLTLENAASSPSPGYNHHRQPSMPSHLAIHIQKGFHDNLLSNSLTTKLKQSRNDAVHNKENASRIISARPPKQARKSSTRVSSKNDYCDRDVNLRDASRSGSGYSSVHSDGRRTGSAVSDDRLPHLLSGRRGTSSRGSSNNRRTNSADLFIGREPSSSRNSRVSASTSFYPSTESSGLAFESCSVDHTIKVVKKDGVFQSIDKYAFGRYGAREVDYGCRGLACDYELFTLPLSNQDTAVSANKLPVSRERSEVSKKSMKVSWSHVTEHSGNLLEGTDTRMDGNATPSTTHTNSIAISKCKTAFKRPDHSTGRSSIKSIGVNWTVPTIAPKEEEDSVTAATTTTPSSSSPSRPMWSWLISPESPQQKQPRVKSVGHLSRASKSKESPNPSPIGRSTSMFDIRTQHRRDVHPVATAMDRQGTSVTKTKWHVPNHTSCNSVDAKQVAMARLELVKRPGKKIVICGDKIAEDIDVALKIKENGRGNSEANNDYDDGEDEDHDDEYYEATVLMMQDDKGKSDDGVTTSTSRRDDTTMSSPTKSRSTTFQY